MAYSAVLRCLIVCFAFGALVSATKLQESKPLQKSTGHRLERLKNELIQAKKKSIQSDAKDDAESQIKNLLAAVKATKQTVSKTPVEDSSDSKELLEETDLTASKQPVKAINEKDAKKPVKAPALSASKARDDDEDDDDDDEEDDDEEEDDDDKKLQSVKVTNEKASKKSVKVPALIDAKARDDDDEDIYIFDDIFYHADALAGEIKTQCDIDIAAIYESYSPVTLNDVNDAQRNLVSAAWKLSTTLSATPGFADGLKSFLDSNEYSVAKVADNVEKTMAKIDKTLKSDNKKIFCAEARIIADRLKMSLYGGTGFANGYLCNKFSVELGRHGSDAAKLLKAVSDDENLLKVYARHLVGDIECYEKELEAFLKVVPSTPFNAESSLQTAAFTSDFLIDYGTVLLYHRIIIQNEATIIELLASGGDDGDDGDVEKGAAAEKGLTNQLYKLLTKLQEVSAKKKAAEAALRDRAGSSMPVRGEKSFLKESYYRKRVNN